MTLMSCYRVKHPKKQSGRYGIEIETETEEEYFLPDLKYWKVEGDGSLRNFGYEYILKRPLSLSDVQKALQEFNSFRVDEGVKFDEDSTSTSVHVHVNMQDEKLLTLANFLTFWTMFEEILLDFSGHTRQDNIFCLGHMNAGGLSRTWHQFLHRLVEGKFEAIEQLDINQLKYSSLNIAPLRNFGSVEVRTMRGTTDINLISVWIRVLDCILEASRAEHRTPASILREYKEKGEGLFYEVFEFVGSSLFDYSEEFVKEKIEGNLWFVRALSVATGNWQKINTALPEAVAEWVAKEDAKVAAKFPAGSMAGGLTLQQVQDMLISMPPEPMMIVDEMSDYADVNPFDDSDFDEDDDD